MNNEKFSSTFAIGFRELFRILVPGLLLLTFIRLEFPDLLAKQGFDLPFGYLFIIAFLLGLITSVFQRFISSRNKPWTDIWPLKVWNRDFRSQIDRLDDEVKIALGSTKPILESDYDAEYKYFLETKMDRAFVERVHYFTSFYYLLAQISQSLILFGVTDICLMFTRTSSFIWYLTAAALYFIGSWAFHKYSAFQLGKIINEQIMMVRLSRNIFGSIQTELESLDRSRLLVNTCRSLLDEIVLDPQKRGFEVECVELPSTDWRTGLNVTVFKLTIETSYPISISGEPGGYKGFYKERVESVLNHIVSVHNKEDHLFKVVVEVVPSKVHDDNLESLLPLDLALANGVIEDRSPVLQVASKYNFKYVLIRGRHLIGPNPGLVQVVEEICTNNIPETALDLFSGTGIIPMVLNRYGVSNITSVDKAPHFGGVKKYLETIGTVRCIFSDVFSFPLSDNYDLVTADPYYQDSLNFLNTKIDDIYQKSKVFVFVCCGVENGYLRAQCRDIIKTRFGEHIEERILFGQSILIAKK